MEDLQSLLEKINRDGVEKAEAEAKKIVDAAKAKSDALLKDARAQAEQAKKDAEKAAVDVIAVAEIKDYAAPVKSAELGDRTKLAVRGNEVSGFAFKKGEPVEIYVTLDYRDYLSLEVECYEYK